MKRKTYIQKKVDYNFPVFSEEFYKDGIRDGSTEEDIETRARAEEILEKEKFHDLDYLSITDKILLWMKLRGYTNNKVGGILGLSYWQTIQKESGCFSKIYRNN